MSPIRPPALGARALVALSIVAAGCGPAPVGTGDAVPSLSEESLAGAQAPTATRTPLGLEPQPPTGERATEGPAEVEAVPTLDPTLEAVYADFVPPLRGDAQAPLIVYVFTDYLCPQCRTLARETLVEVDRRYVGGGQVALSLVDLPMPAHGYPAFAAHEAAHCASEQGRYWEMHDALFEHQTDLASVDVGQELRARSLVVEIGGRIGLETEPLESCLEAGRYRTLVSAMEQTAIESGVEVAPTLILQSEAGTDIVTGYVTFAQLRPTLEAALSRARATPRR